MISYSENPSASGMIAFVSEDFVDRLSADARDNLQRTMYEIYGSMVEE